jgi:hypothetical protein
LTLIACVAWSLAVPLLTGPDEWAHAYRAAAIVRGQVTGVPTEAFGNSVVAVRVPEAMTAAGEGADCFVGKPREAWHNSLFNFDLATCERPTGDSHLVDATTSEHRGQPFYYLLVGLPTLAFPSVFGAYLMRIAGGALCSALLASAFVSLRRLRGNSLVALGVALAVTPAVLYFSATVNNIGLEMAAGLALAVSGAALVRGEAEPDGRLVTRTGVALVALTLARGLSPGYAVVTVVALALVTSPDRRRALARRADVRLWAAVAAGAFVVSGAWLVWVHVRFDLPPRSGMGLVDAVAELRWDLRDLVGVFGTTDVSPPWVLHLAWGLAAVVVVAAAYRAGGRREVAVGALVIAGSVALLVSGDGLSIPDSGFWWQGRYVMAPVVGGLVVATLGPSPSGSRPDRRPLSLGPPVLAVLVGVHLWAFLYAVRHYSVSYRGTVNPARFLTDTLWAPPLAPAAVWVLAYAGAVGAGAVLLWRGSAPAPAPALDEDPPVEGRRDEPAAALAGGS